jgi:AcrR family transcriptional regulator
MSRTSTLSDEEIVARARAVFVEHGYAARTRQIAAAVGLTWGAIALRFQTKQALFQAAMTGPALQPDNTGCEQAANAKLPDLLQRLRTHLRERWPLRLQCRLASPAAGIEEDEEGLLPMLAALFETHARRGSIRSDMSPTALARVVLALMTGDVVQCFVARRPSGATDRTFVDEVVRLLSGTVNEACEPELDYAG